MLSRLDLRGSDVDLVTALARPAGDDAGPIATVREIVADVRVRGDDALRDLTERFDGGRSDELLVPEKDILAALDDAPAPFRAALDYAREEITAYHEAQRGDEVR